MSEGDPRFAIPPLVVCVRGPSRSGKTALCEALIRALGARATIGWCKRTHHGLDLPHKSSGRVWASGAAAMAVQAADRVQVTVRPDPNAGRDADALIAALPAGLDIVLFESHSPERFPVFLAEAAEPVPDERVLGRFSLDRVEDLAPVWAESLLRMASPASRRCGHGHSITVRRPGAELAMARGHEEVSPSCR
ncbi:MAG: molybdopterin-guanine dinucleotide biosynthesis protein MobB [Gemmataceae bacterium]|nr:molybdopterin-guanine dinucleotide biosynthesis protein MobB [Gemmataceae bacterium]